MADIFYVESGYAENDGYAVKTADASIVQTRTAKTITVTGNAALSSTQYKFARSSIALDGSGDYLTPDVTGFNNNGDFTFEGWFYFSTTGKQQRIFRRGSSTPNTVSCYINASNYLNVYFNGVTATATTNAITTGQWYHIAYSKQGSTINGYINGTRVCYATNATGSVTTTDPFDIGGDRYAAANTILGYMDEIRLLDSYIYSGATITVPTQPFFNNGNTVFLIHGDSPSIVDDAGGTGVNAQATLTTSPTNAQFGVATLNAVAGVSSTITVISPVNGTATLNSTATLSSAVTRITSASSTLSCQATVNSQANAVRNFSATLASQASVQSSAERTRTNSASLNSQANLSINAGNSLSGSANLTAEFNTQIDIEITRGSATLLASAGSLSVQANAIKRIGQITNIPGANGATTAIRISSSNVATSGQAVGWTINPGTAISFWAKKDQVSDTNGVFINGNRYAAPYVSGLTVELKSTKLEFRARYYTDDNPVNETILEWNDVGDIVIDTEWHHYFFYVETWTEQGFGREYKVRLYQDGVNLGAVSTFSPDDINTEIRGPLNIGFEKTWNSSTNVFEITNTTKILNGCVAQLWLSNAVASDYSISSWYNNGYVSALPSGGLITSTLNYPYSGTSLYKVSGTTLIPENLTYERLCNQNGVKFLNAVASLSPIGGLLKTSSAGLSVQASVQAQGDKNVLGKATVNALATLQAAVRKLPGTGANLDATATLTAKAYKIEQFSATLSAQADLTTSPTYAIFGQGTISAQAGLRVVTGNEATLSASATLTSSPNQFMGGFATLTAQANISAQGDIVKDARATLRAQASLTGKLSIVPIPDDLQTIFVEAENRTIEMLFDTRNVVVEIESNLNRILSETREIIVDYESNELREAVEPALEVTTARIRRVPA